MNACPKKLKLVLVTGLSGAGKNSVLRALEDLGFETMDNPPLDTLEELATHSERDLAIGGRCALARLLRGFRPGQPGALAPGAKNSPPAWSSPPPRTKFCCAAIRKRAAATPLAQTGKVAEGIVLERELTDSLARQADLRIDTSSLAITRLRALIEQNFGQGSPGMAISLVSFAYPAGLPPEADLVFDARFLKNPFYDAALRPLCGLDPEIVPVRRARP